MANKVAESTEDKRGQKRKRDDDDVAAGGSEKRWPGWPGESVFRILVPSGKVGGLIGRRGETIKRIRRESGARIQILRGPQGAPERIAIISATEVYGASVSPAMDGLLKLLKHIVDSTVSVIRLLLPESQLGSLIGRKGAAIRSMQEATNCVVRIIDDLPHVALRDDRVFEVEGKPAGVHKTVELISNHLRRFLVDRSVLPLFEIHMQLPLLHMEQNMSPPQPWGSTQAQPPNSGGNPGCGGNRGYGGNSGYGSSPGYWGNLGYRNPRQFMPPQPHDNFYPPPEVPRYEQPPHFGIFTYVRDAPPMRGPPSANQQQPTLVEKWQGKHIRSKHGRRKMMAYTTNPSNRISKKNANMAAIIPLVGDKSQEGDFMEGNFGYDANLLAAHTSLDMESWIQTWGPPPSHLHEEPISTLVAEFQLGNSILQEKIKLIGEQYVALRRIRGDGNCFFRSFMFSYLEHVLETQDVGEVDRVTANIEQCKKTLKSLGITENTFKDFFVLKSVLLGREDSVSRDGLLESSRDPSISNDVVRCFRYVTMGEIRRRSDFFKPFILGLTNDTMDVEQYCKCSVEPMGEESEEVHVTALSNALGVAIRVVNLDSSVCEDGFNHHDFIPDAATAAEDRPPFVTLLYRPGHYDILYPK